VATRQEQLVKHAVVVAFQHLEGEATEWVEVFPRLPFAELQSIKGRHIYIGNGVYVPAAQDVPLSKVYIPYTKRVW